MNRSTDQTQGPASPAGPSCVKLKVCGVTLPEQATALRGLGVHMLGLNFHPASPRFVPPDLARQLVQAWSDPASAVGLFVDRSTEDILALQAQTGFGIAQLHGDEPDGTIVQVAAQMPVIKAFRIKDATSLDEAAAQLDRLRQQGVELLAALIDGYSAAAHGGTGVTVGRDLVLAACCLHHRLMLAGGLTPENLAQRLAWISPWAVDVASGVESRPGVKNLDAVAAMLRVMAENAH